MIKELNNQGYDVHYTFEPQSGAKGEFYVYVTNDGKKRCVFSNNKTVGDNNTKFGNKINDNMLKDIVDNCLGQQ